MTNPYKIDIEPQEYHPLQSPPAPGEERYELLPSEVNQIVDRHNSLQSSVSPQWHPGYDGSRCWHPDENGIPIDYYAVAGASSEQLSIASPPFSQYWVSIDPAPYERSFGDGVSTTISMPHPKSRVSSAFVIDTANNKPIAVDVDWMTTPGYVIVGPFHVAPDTNRMKLIVEGI